jgi:CrcB protein
MSYLLVALGGGLGAVARHGLGQASLRAFGPGFPVGTLAANVLGGLVMGMLVGWLATKDSGQTLRLFLGVGLLGGFTTFSAFSLDAMLMIERGNWGMAGLYIGGSVILSIAALALGLMIARGMFA